MKHKKFMLLAIEEAKRSAQSIGCGVVIVMNGRVIAKTHNTQSITNNATAHAEINAIAKAGSVLGRKDLEGCEIYCTCEPCPMCLSAIIFAKIPKLLYGTSMKETFPDNLPITLTTEELLTHSSHKLTLLGGYMKEECSVLLRK